MIVILLRLLKWLVRKFQLWCHTGRSGANHRATKSIPSATKMTTTMRSTILSTIPPLLPPKLLSLAYYLHKGPIIILIVLKVPHASRAVIFLSPPQFYHFLRLGVTCSVWMTRGLTFRPRHRLFFKIYSFVLTYIVHDCTYIWAFLSCASVLNVLDKDGPFYHNYWTYKLGRILA